MPRWLEAGESLAEAKRACGWGVPTKGQVSVACQGGLRLGSPWQKPRGLVVGESQQKDKCPLRAKMA